MKLDRSFCFMYLMKRFFFSIVSLRRLRVEEIFVFCIYNVYCGAMVKIIKWLVFNRLNRFSAYNDIPILIHIYQSNDKRRGYRSCPLVESRAHSWSPLIWPTRTGWISSLESFGGALLWWSSPTGFIGSGSGRRGLRYHSLRAGGIKFDIFTRGYSFEWNMVIIGLTPSFVWSLGCQPCAGWNFRLKLAQNAFFFRVKLLKEDFSTCAHGVLSSSHASLNFPPLNLFRLKLFLYWIKLWDYNSYYANAKGLCPFTFFTTSQRNSALYLPTNTISQILRKSVKTKLSNWMGIIILTCGRTDATPNLPEPPLLVYLKT